MLSQHNFIILYSPKMNGLSIQSSLSTLILLGLFLYKLDIRRCETSKGLGVRQFRKQKKIKLRISQRALSYRTYMAYFCSMDLKKASVQFSRSVVSNSLRPHESQHTRPHCPSPPTPGIHPNSRPSSR